MTSRTTYLPGEASTEASREGIAAQNSPGPPASPAVARHFGRAWPVLTVLVVSTVLSLAYYHRSWEAPNDSWSAPLGDAQQTMWFLAWVPHAILHGHSSLLSNYQLFPRGENLMWNTSIILPSFLLAPVTLLAGPIFSYNLLLTLAPVATACASYFAFRRYVTARVAAVVGALLFAFSPYLLHQAVHPQLSVLALMPVTLLLLDELLVRQHWHWWVSGGLLGVTCAAQLLVGEEILLIEAMMAVVAVVTLLALHPRQVRGRLSHGLRAAAATIVVFAVLAAYPLKVQLLGPLRVKVVHGPSNYVTDLMNFVQPVFQIIDVKVAHQPLGFTGNPVEWAGYLGFPLLLVVAVTLALNLRRRPVVPIAAALLAVFAVLSLGPHLHINGHSGPTMPWAAFDHLPGLNNILPARMGVAVDLAATLLFSIFVDAVIAARRWAPKVLGAGLAVAVVISWLPSLPPLSSQTIPSFFTTSAKDQLPDGSVAVVTPYIYGPTSEEAVVWQAASGMRYEMVDGWMIVPFSHRGPLSALALTLEGLEHKTVPVTPQLAAGVGAVLRADRVQEVIVGPGAGERRTIAFFSLLFHRGPEMQAGGVSIFRVPPPR